MKPSPLDTAMTADARPVEFAGIEEALAELRAGRMIVVVDDADRENEGDLTLAAEKTTPEAVAFMAAQGRGLICAALTPERLDQLHIRMMTERNTSRFGTAFCESVDARAGVTTGISAADRARTIQALVDEATRPEDLARPGHIFPLRARPGGVLARAGQTEAAVDLARLAGMRPAGVICEIMNADGTMARAPHLAEFCRQHRLKMITVADLIRYRLQNERSVHRIGETRLRLAQGEGRLLAYRSDLDDEIHSALVVGQPSHERPVLVRVQTHCFAGAVLHSPDCSCGLAIERALEMISEQGEGIFIYLHQTSPGWRIEGGEIRHGSTAIEPGTERDRQIQRQTGLGAQILLDLDCRQIRLLTDHPRRLGGLAGYGLEIIEQVPLGIREPGNARR